jgi:broad specificity phosphatase PhoE
MAASFGQNGHQPKGEPPMLRLILVRHGQTAWNAGADAGEHFRGRIDVLLNELGRRQALEAGRRLASAPIAAVYASPLRRALDTALPIAEAHGLPVHPFQGLLDIDYGDWGGLSHVAVAEKWPDLYALWRSAPQEVQIPGGEHLDDVRRRAMEGVSTLVQRHDGEIIVLVGHQAVNKTLICALLGLGTEAFWRIRQDTGCINRFDYQAGVFSVLTLNETCHLRPQPAGLDHLPR